MLVCFTDMVVNVMSSYLLHECSAFGRVLTIKADCVALGGCSLSLDNWMKGLSIKLLEIIHGQWLYRNMLIHDTASGMKAVERKEDLQKAIEEEIEVGGARLEKQDGYLLEINLEDLETSSGEDQYYWLVGIRAARADRILRRRQQERVARKRTRGGRALSLILLLLHAGGY